MWPVNSFVTLTYEETGPELVYRDFQLFMKRLRRALKKKFGFICAVSTANGMAALISMPCFLIAGFLTPRSSVEMAIALSIGAISLSVSGAMVAVCSAK